MPITPVLRNAFDLPDATLTDRVVGPGRYAAVTAAHPDLDPIGAGR
ncbi:hypothetical protein [Citricoccus sp. CH26A]|nr:hypothetical protein [Citricoccus sp. CH26A]